MSSNTSRMSKGGIISRNTSSSPVPYIVVMIMSVIFTIYVLEAEPLRVQIIVAIAYILGAAMGCTATFLAESCVLDRTNSKHTATPTRDSSGFVPVTLGAQEDRIYNVLRDMGHKPGLARRAAAYASREGVPWEQAMKLAQDWIRRIDP